MNQPIISHVKYDIQGSYDGQWWEKRSEHSYANLDHAHAVAKEWGLNHAEQTFRVIEVREMWTVTENPNAIDSRMCLPCGKPFPNTAELEAHDCPIVRRDAEAKKQDQSTRQLPDLRQLANPKKADPETVAEIHASRCPECKGSGCPQCGYKGVPRTGCPRHHIADKRGGRAPELGSIPACESGATYGAWSEGAGGFVYSGVDCATEVANRAADELRTLAKDDDTDTFQILAICPDHEEQPKVGCEECGAESDEGEGETEAATGFLVDPHTWLRRSY
jgi:hypothetical protein